MAIAPDPKATFDYILIEDRDTEDQSVFQLRSLTVTEEAQVTDRLFAQTPGADEMSLRVGTQQLEIVRLGLVGWSNFRDSKGLEVTFKKRRAAGLEVPTDATLDRIGPWLTEIANAITERGKVTESEGN